MPIILDDFTPENIAVIERLDTTRIPRHIAIIMDGNGRWATQQGLPRVVGHHAGTESIRAIVKACRGLGVEFITLYSFSTENWTRPDNEVHALMDLMEEQLRLEMAYLHDQGVRVLHLGRQDGLPASLQQALSDAMVVTAANTRITMVLAINYSGRAELLDAAKRMARHALASGVDIESLTEDHLARELYLPDIPDPELLIRTANEMRVSNYLLWQIAYSEFWVTQVLWPDFRAQHLLEAIEEYQHRQRKFGRVIP